MGSVKQRGQALVFMAGGMILLFAVMGLLIDSGRAALDKREMQNAADAAALAGSTYLMNNGPTNNAFATSKAAAIANGWPTKGTITVCPVDATGTDQPGCAYTIATTGVHVTLVEAQVAYFLPVFGIKSYKVGAQAVAQFRISGTANVFPMAILEGSCAQVGATCTVTIPQGNVPLETVAQLYDCGGGTPIWSGNTVPVTIFDPTTPIYSCSKSQDATPGGPYTVGVYASTSPVGGPCASGHDVVGCITVVRFISITITAYNSKDKLATFTVVAKLSPVQAGVAQEKITK
jgi:Flp pilus assembly protein TadG